MNFDTGSLMTYIYIYKTVRGTVGKCGLRAGRKSLQEKRK